MPLASTWRGSCATPGWQAPVAVPAVTRSRVKHARQREAAVGSWTSRPAEAADVVVPSEGSGQRWAMGVIHLHMVGQTPKVHLVQAVYMLMIWSLSQWRDDKRVGVLEWAGRDMSFTAERLEVTVDQSPLWAESRPSYRNKLVKTPPDAISSHGSNFTGTIISQIVAM